MVAILIAIVLVAGVGFILSSPWRLRRAARRDESVELTVLRGEVAELAAARDAKYREIRDAELDHQTGKLSDADFHIVDGALRAEAIALLKRLDRAQSRLEKLIKREAADAEASPGEERSAHHDAPAGAHDVDGLEGREEADGDRPESRTEDDVDRPETRASDGVDRPETRASHAADAQ